LITAISFSYSDDSMNYRGLKLMNHFLNFDNLIRINLPICNSNKPDGETPKEVHELDDKIRKSDTLVFAIPEYSGHYSVGFKNFMDWLVVKSNYNADLGQDYCISDKSIYVITFTPSKPGSGDRHFTMTKELIEKLGGKVKKMFVKNLCWENLLPTNYSFIEKECKQIMRKTMKNEVGGWINKFNDWDDKWKN
tara:strand:- start:31 stop:609 length:579 start_codon:yes stop_codon:yes gene_type:complete